MNTNRPVRKYSRLAYVWKWVKYGVRLTVILPVWGLLPIIAFSGMAGIPIFALSALMGLLASTERLFNIGLIGLLFSVVGAMAGRRLLQLAFQPDLLKSHFLNPAVPEGNSVLPDEETLVRASAPNAETQRAELLRASTDTTDTPPEKLLRSKGMTPLFSSSKPPKDKQ